MKPEQFSLATTPAGAGVVFTPEERERHLYIVGKSGAGKSTFLFNLAMGDIFAGKGVAVIDPHGDLALDILSQRPAPPAKFVSHQVITSGNVDHYYSNDMLLSPAVAAART